MTKCACGRPLHNNVVTCDQCQDNAAEALQSLTGRFGPIPCQECHRMTEKNRDCANHLLPSGFRWIPGLVEDLEVAFKREARLGEGGGSSERPVFFNVKAGEHLSSLHMFLSGWARIVSEERGIDIDCADDSASIATWLLSSIVWLSHHKAGAEFVSGLLREVDEATHVTDRRADRWYAGPCELPVENRTKACDGELWAKPGKGNTVDCPECGRSTDVAERRRQLLEYSRDELMPIGIIASALTSFGQPVDRGQLDTWVSRGQLERKGERVHNGRVTALYRVGSAADLLAAKNRRAQEREAKKAKGA